MRRRSQIVCLCRLQDNVQVLCSQLFPEPSPHDVVTFPFKLLQKTKNVSSLFRRFVVVNRIIPAIIQVSKYSSPKRSMWQSSLEGSCSGILQESLVSVSPEEVLGADILVWVLRAFLQWLSVSPVFPMLVPEVVGVDTGNDQAWDHSTVNGQLSII